MPEKFLRTGIICKNKKAYFDYEVVEEYEAGIVLFGSEVKSLRLGGINMSDAHAAVETSLKTEEIFLYNLDIPHYKYANNMNHDPKRRKKLLLNRKEIKRLLGRSEQKGLTIIPLLLFFNNKGLAKLKIGLCKGKSKYDKRQDIKEKDWKRQKERLLKES